MNALITGANGHIGCHVVRACQHAGITPIAFVREGADLRGLAGCDVEVRTGDITDAESVGKAMAHIELVFHVAAVHRNWTRDEASMMGPARDGTRNVLDAARRAGVRRVVCTSTAATIGFSDDPNKPLDEEKQIGSPRSLYIRTKLAGEQVALEVARTGALEVVVVNPSGVFGPLDYRLTPATRALIGLLQGDPAFFAVTMTDVRDVGLGHVLAAQRGKSGERYLLTGDVLPPRAASELLGRLTGIKPPNLRPPKFLLRLLAGMAERKARKTGEDAAITRDVIEDAYGRHLAYNAHKARTELGATFRAPEAVMRDAVRWLLHVGALKPKVAATVRAHLGEAAEPDREWLAAVGQARAS